jgi:hypothetical protein
MDDKLSEIIAIMFMGCVIGMLISFIANIDD